MSLEKSLRSFNKDMQPKHQVLFGALGLMIDGRPVVNVPTRNGYVYVRMFNNPSEVIQAKNTEVPPNYDLAVLLSFDGISYTVTGIDTNTLGDWGSHSAFVPNHAPQHMFTEGGGADPIFLDSRQFVPLSVAPTGTYGADSVYINQGTYMRSDGSFHSFGGTGTPSLLGYAPSDDTAVMLLIYCDTTTGNPGYILGDTYFSQEVTDAADIVQYLPNLTGTSDIPLGALRLVSGTSSYVWQELYDVRQFYAGGGAATFLELTDTPSVYTGQSLKLIRVNDGETALEFYAISDDYARLDLSNQPFVAAVDSTTAFQVQANDATPVFNVDTTNGRVGIGTDSPDEVLDVLDGIIQSRLSNDTISNFSAYSPAADFPRALYNIGHSASDVNCGFYVYPEYGTNSSPIPVLMVLGTVKDATGSDGNSRQMLFMQTSTYASFSSGSGTGNAAGTNLYLSTQTYLGTKPGLIMDNSSRQLVTIGAYTGGAAQFNVIGRVGSIVQSITRANSIQTVNISEIQLGDTTITGGWDKDGTLFMRETTTPTGVTNFGKLYPKSDNRLYFQDGAGAEHIVHGFPLYKSYNVSTQGLGVNPDVYAAGYLEFSTTDANLTNASTTVTIGTANISHAAHAFIVAGGAGTTDGSDLVLTASGTSINDDGTRQVGDSEVIVADCTASTTDLHYETDKKWLGTVTFTLSSTGGTTFSYDFNYGLAKYEDFNNEDFDLVGIEAVGLAGANDSTFDIKVMHYNSVWTYAATGFDAIIAGNTIASLATDHATDDQLSNNDHFAWKRANLSTTVSGSGSEGIIIRVESSANNAVEYCNIHLAVEF